MLGSPATGVGIGHGFNDLIGRAEIAGIVSGPEVVVNRLASVLKRGTVAQFRVRALILNGSMVSLRSLLGRVKDAGQVQIQLLLARFCELLF